MPTIDNRLPTEGTQQDILNAILQIVSTLTVDDNGHVIVNDSGTFLAQRNNLKIGGVYTEDVSGDDTTVANVIRKMTKAELLSLQGEAKKGIQVTTDEPSVLPLTTDWVEAKGGNTSTQLLDNMNNSIAPAEYGTKSVSDYSVNDVFMLNGTRMVATSAISQGDTFVVYPATGYNCQPQTVEEKFDTKADISAIPTKTSQLTNDSSYAVYTLPRITRDANVGASPATINWLEYGNTSTHIPTTDFYHIISFGSQDSPYGTQLALKMTGGVGLYIRQKNAGTWSAWYKATLTQV